MPSRPRRCWFHVPIEDPTTLGEPIHAYSVVGGAASRRRVALGWTQCGWQASSEENVFLMAKRIIRTAQNGLEESCIHVAPAILAL